MQKKSFAAAVKAAFPHTIPIMTGYLAVGLAVFGADNMVIPAMVLTLIVLLAGRRKLCA